MPQHGTVKVYYGEGRGKTSAAMGDVLRAVSIGQNVCVVFFMKGLRSGAEYESLKCLSVEYSVFGRSGFLSGADAHEVDTQLCCQALTYAEEQIGSGKWDLVVLDEINNAKYYGLIAVDDIVKLLTNRPKHTSIILTGKVVDNEVSQHANLVCQFVKIKHPYDKGILAQKGIDY
jgi:cob(I)alamin adenosyltransferase